MQSLRSILVGVDFRPGSASALRYASRFAAQGADVRAVHVVDVVRLGVNATAANDPIQDRIEAGLRAEALAEWEAYSREAGLAAPVPFEVLVDNRIAGLRKAVLERTPDLLVLGAFGRRDLEIGIGTVSTACVRHAPVDVLLVRDGHEGAFRRIVVAVDLSSTSALALQRAASFAAAEGAELKVFHVVEQARQWSAMPNQASSLERLGTSITERQAALDAFVADALADGARDKVAVECRAHGRHRSEIAAYAEEAGADLIVVGTRGRSNVRDVLLGSTAEKLLQTCGCSVLAVKPPGVAQAGGGHAANRSRADVGA